MPEIIAIAALGKSTRYICKDDRLLWHIPEDLKHVKEATTNYPIIMGRKTFASIGKPLPNRTNIVLSRNKDFSVPEEVKLASSLEEALDIARESAGGTKKIFIFGGAEIYKLALPYTNKLMLTLVDDDKPGDAVFPDYEHEFQEIARHGVREHEGLRYEWVDYARK